MKISIYVMLLTLFLFLSCKEEKEEPKPEQQNEISYPAKLNDVQSKIQDIFDKLSMDLRKSTENLSKTNQSEALIRTALVDFCSRYSFVYDCAFVDTLGIMRYLEPEEYRAYEGKDISDQEQIKHILKEKKPVLSTSFKAVEGFMAVDMEYPVFNEQGDYQGSISLLIKPEEFLSEVIKPVSTGLPIEIWLIEPGGRVIYDDDSSEIGRNIVTDSMYLAYPELIDVAKKISNDKEGVIEYTFLAKGMKENIKKKAFWKTISIFETEWRIVLTSPSNYNFIPVNDTILGTMKTALDELAHNKAFLMNVKNGNKEAVMTEFFKFQRDYPATYAVELVSPELVNLYGYPEEHSLENYKIDSETDPQTKSYIEALKNREAIIIDQILFEGWAGTFYLTPLKLDGEFLGTIYFIVPKH